MTRNRSTQRKCTSRKIAFQLPVVAVEFTGKPAGSQLPEWPEQLLDVLAGGLKCHIAYDQLGARLLAGPKALLWLGLASRLVSLNVAHAQLHAQLVPVQQ